MNSRSYIPTGKSGGSPQLHEVLRIRNASCRTLVWVYAYACMVPGSFFCQFQWRSMEQLAAPKSGDYQRALSSKHTVSSDLQLPPDVLATVAEERAPKKTMRRD